jgi:hypothetical protein
VSVYSHEPIDEVATLRDEIYYLRGLLREMVDGPTPANWVAKARVALDGTTVQPEGDTK